MTTRKPLSILVIGAGNVGRRFVTKTVAKDVLENFLCFTIRRVPGMQNMRYLTAATGDLELDKRTWAFEDSAQLWSKPDFRDFNLTSIVFCSELSLSQPPLLDIAEEALLRKIPSSLIYLHLDRSKQSDQQKVLLEHWSQLGATIQTAHVSDAMEFSGSYSLRSADE